MSEADEYLDSLVAEQQERLESAVRGEPNEDELEDAPTGRTEYSLDDLNFQSDIIGDDSLPAVWNYLQNSKLTKDCKFKLYNIYRIHASQDNVLTNASAKMLENKRTEFELAVAFAKTTISGENVLFGDFNTVVENLASKIETRHSRGYKGLERYAQISSYQHVTRSEKVGTEQQNDEQESGFNRLPFINR